MTPGSLTTALRETLALFDGSCSPLTTTEVADRLDLGRRSTYERLERLVDHGELETKRVGSNGRVWWRPATTSATASSAGIGTEQRLGHDTRQFELLVDAIEEYAIFVLDPDGKVRSWNEGARKIKGYREDEIVGEHFSAFYTPDDRAAGVPERNLGDAVERGDVEDEGWRVRADGTRFWANVTITAIYDGDGVLRDFAEVTRDTTECREREQQLRHQRDLVERIFETSPVGLGVLSRDGLTRVNARGAGIYGSNTDDVDEDDVGEPAVYDADGHPVPPEERPNARVFATGEPVDAWECQFERPDGTRRWLSVSAAPISVDGDVEHVVVATEDVTHLKQQARRLERQRDELEAELHEVFARIDDAVFALDAEWRFTHLNGEAERLLKRDETELAGSTIWKAFPEAVGSRSQREYERAMETQESVTFDEFDPALDTWFEVHAYPSETGLSVYFRDVTDRKERVLELERYETIFETVGDTIYVVDDRQRLLKVNRAAEELTGYDRDEIVGKTVADFIGEAAAAQVPDLGEGLPVDDPEVAAAEFTLTTADGSALPIDVRFTRLPTPDGRVERVGVVRDVSERVARERELEESEQRYRTLVEHFPNGIVTMFDGDLRYVIGGGKLYDAFDRSPDEMIGKTIYEHNSKEEVEILEPLYLDAFTGESRSLQTEYAGRTVQLWTVPVTDEAGDVFAGMAMSQDVTDRVARERQLERQREHLTALDALNGIFRGVTEAVIEQSTREEIEGSVCERLAGSDSYLFAWIGDVDAETRTMRLRTEAGVDGYLDGVTISVDPDDPRSGGPTGRAVETHEMQVTEDAIEDEDYAWWRECAWKYGFRSSAAIPIVHEGVLFGVLNVYADRSNAFSGDERTVIEHLGEVVGHAIAAVEQKRALTSDEVVELEFQISNVLAAFDLPASDDGRLTLDRAVPIGHADYLEYGTATDGMLDVLDRLVCELPHWESVRLLDEATDAGVTRFELRLVDPPVVSTVTALGGYVERAIIEDGDYYMRIHLAPNADARRLIEVVKEAYPMAQLLTRQQITRDSDSVIRLSSVLVEELTDRQRSALESAYFAGYFEWPRDTKGEEVADSLGVSAATFHQHLRKAERKLLQVALDDAAPV